MNAKLIKQFLDKCGGFSNDHKVYTIVMSNLLVMTLAGHSECSVSGNCVPHLLPRVLREGNTVLLGDLYHIYDVFISERGDAKEIEGFENG